jgi:hypothetical protein
VRAVDQDLGRRSARRRERNEHLLPDTFRRPPYEPVAERLFRTVAGGRINPATTRFHHMDDAADHPPVIDPSNAPNLVRKQWPKPLQLLIAQPELDQIQT